MIARLPPLPPQLRMHRHPAVVVDLLLLLLLLRVISQWRHRHRHNPLSQGRLRCSKRCATHSVLTPRMCRPPPNAFLLPWIRHLVLLDRLWVRLSHGRRERVVFPLLLVSHMPCRHLRPSPLPLFSPALLPVPPVVVSRTLALPRHLLVVLEEESTNLPQSRLLPLLLHYPPPCLPALHPSYPCLLAVVLPPVGGQRALRI